MARMEDNKECTLWLGVHVAERVLSKIFDNVTRMPIQNPGYDFICSKGYKVDVKSACKSKCGKYYGWSFILRTNRIADYFLFLAFDNRNDLNPMHIWLVKNYGSVINKKGFRIIDTCGELEKWKQYERTDKLNELIHCCDSIRTK